jgi:hypothetical protein
MVVKTLTRFVFAAGYIVALAVSAVQAQTMDTRVPTPELRLECGPEKDPQLLRDAQLRARCFDSFLASQDAPAAGWSEGLTGGGTGTMRPMGPHPYAPNTPIPHAGR